jgi:AAA15 family ATPase/GTPase
MITNVRINNCFIFSNKVEFSLEADMRTKKFPSNVYTEYEYNVLKTVGIFGANNSGKSCLLKCIDIIKNVLLNNSTRFFNNFLPNFFTKNTICELGITFLAEGKKFSFDFKYDVKINEFIYEKFSEISKNSSENILLIRDVQKNEYSIHGEKEYFNEIIKATSKNNILIYLLDEASSEKLKEIKRICLGFAKKIECIDMNNLSINKTIEYIKNENTRENIVNFIKNVDIYLDDFKYIPNTNREIEVQNNNSPKETNPNLVVFFKLMSVYKGISVPSVLFDSVGSQKVEALAGYIIDALKNGKILIIDELDSSLHFKLTRAIVAMFNNDSNNKAQLIFTAHDINLMDCKKLFRKEQIWFTHKDDEDIFLYSLSDFTARNVGVRDTSDIIDKYKNGIFGALPDPDIINTLFEVM